MAKFPLDFFSEDPPHDAIRDAFVKVRSAAGLVNNYETSCHKTFVDVLRVVCRAYWLCAVLLRTG